MSVEAAIRRPPLSGRADAPKRVSHSQTPNIYHSCGDHTARQNQHHLVETRERTECEARPSKTASLLRAFAADAVYERIALHSAAGTTAARALGIPHIVELNAPLPEEAARYRQLERPADAERLERETLAGAPGWPDQTTPAP